MKRVFIIFALLFTSAIYLTACNSNPSVQGHFNNEEYVVSLNETINFYDEFTINKGASKQDITFVSSNDEIISFKNGGTFIANSSGRALIFAQYHNETFAQANIIVKYKFSTPTKPSVNEEGTITWEPSFLLTSDGMVYASEYIVEYAAVTGDATLNVDELTFSQEIVEKSFTLPNKGSYYVRLTALGQENKYIDNSNSSQVYIINNGVMGIVENIKIETSQSILDETATVSWDSKEHSLYDIYLNGFKIFENLQESSFTYNFNMVENGQEVTLRIVTKDANGELLESESIVNLGKLNSPILQYQSDGMSYLFWQDVENASSYLMYVNDLVLGSQTYLNFLPEQNNQVLFEDMQSSLYMINLSSIGGGENGFYLNSKPTESILIAKLAKPVVDITFEGQKAIFNFAEQFYNNRYLIKWADKSQIVTGDNCEIDLSDLESNDYTFTVQALPNIENGEIVPYEQVGQTTQMILASDKFTFDFTILEQITNVNHTLQDNVSVFGFNEVIGANYYQIYVNESLIDYADIKIEAEYVTIRVDTLKNIQPIDGKYQITIIAGLKNDEVEYAPKVVYNKELTILDIVKADDNQINGYYTWQKIDNQYAYYEYQIFEADSNYQVLNDVPIASGGTSENMTVEKLEFGYYVIKIYTVSTNFNNSLNANFYDEDCYFQANFLVYEQIETPNVTFSSTDDYLLTIESTEFNGTYEIYVDGELDGGVTLNPEQKQIVYLLKNQFEQEKTYNLEIIATSGTLFDKNLHTDSQPFMLTVTRVGEPQFEAREVVNSQSIKTGEEIVVESTSFVEYPIIKLVSHNGEQVNIDNGYVLNITDQTVYSSNFILSFAFVASENDGNNYYIDSFERVVNFNRVPAPTNIAYSDEIVSWESDNEKIEGYFVTVILTNSTNGNYYYRLFTQNKSLNLQDLIDERCREDIYFESSYRQADDVRVEVYSYANGMNENAYYLPSTKGTTASGQNILIVNTLDNPTISFNPNDLLLSWNQVAKDTTYDIYVDGSLAKEDYTNTSINLSDLGNYGYLISKEIYVVAKNVYYLSSAQSNSIYIKQLASIDSLNISQSEGQNIVAFSLNSDLSNISNVYVNGSNENVNYTANQNSGNFNLADFDTQSFTLQVIAQNNSSTYYYINSKETTFTIIDLNSLSFNVTLNQDILTWENIVDDFVGNNIDPISYILTITCNEQSYTITTTQTSYNIQEIEKEIGVILSGDIEIKVTATVSSDYTLTLTNGQAHGYYGYKDSEIINIEKVKEIDVLSYTINDNLDQNGILNQKRNAFVVLSWKDLWTDKENVYFVVTLQNLNVKDTTLTLTNGSTHSNYNLTNDGENYNLTIQSSLFDQGQTTINIRVVCQNNITSQPTSITIDRLSQISNASVNQDGLLTINDSINNTYIMQLSIADRIVEEQLIFDGQSAKTFDLMIEGLLQDVYGYYTISILSYDENGKKLPTSGLYIISGTKLQGIASSEIDNYGFANLTLYTDDFENLVFTVKVTYFGVDFYVNVEPTATDSDNVYKFFLPDFINSLSSSLSIQEGRYSFEITVSKEGSVRSDYHEFTFDYTIEKTLPTLLRQNYAQDYLVLDAPENDDTVGITMLVVYYDITGGTVTGTYYLNDASSLKGYWCINNTTGEKYFTTIIDANLENVTYEECYAVDLNNLFKDYEQGIFDITVVRVGRGDVVNLYDSHNATIYKLNRVIDDIESPDYVRIEGNNLVWQWRADENLAYIDGYKATAYYVTFRSADDDESFRVLSYSSALDLREVDLTAGKTYYITVMAISSANNCIASNESQNQLQTLKYTQPLPIDVVDGVITFEQESFMDTTFMQDITTFFKNTENENELFNIMAEKNYLAPFYFHISTLSSQNLTLRFTALDSSGAETSSYYTMTVPGYLLFPDIVIENNNMDISSERMVSYFELIKAYANTLEDASASNAKDFVKMAETLDYSDQYGLATTSILFDDFGRTIPAGEYSVSLYHAGGNGRYISSNFSLDTKIYLTSAPSVSLSQENNDTSTYYMATFGSAQTYIADTFENGQATNYSLQYVTNYKMILRTNYDTSMGLAFDRGIVFNIVYNQGSGWTVYFGGTALTGVVTSLGDSTKDGFKVNMTLLRERFDEIAIEQGFEAIGVNALIRVDVVASSSDDGYVPNGKSAYFYVRYLDLPTDSLSFQNGQMTITTSLDSTNSILLRYLASGSELETMLVQINNGIANIDLPREGAYQYIVLSLSGSISYNTMNVESKTYAIENVYKLNTPDLSTQNNNLYISYNPADFNYTQEQSLHFMLANDASIKNGEDYYYTSTITRDGRNYITYTVGSLDATGQPVYISELTAQTFYAYLLGNSGTIQSSLSEAITSHGADYVWTFLSMNSQGSYVPTVMLFTSEISQVNAGMLNVLSNQPYIDKGNVVWQPTGNLPQLENATVLYQVDVLYYNKVVGTNEFDTTYDYVSRDIYYTNKDYLSSQYINQNYDYYTIEVTPIAGLPADDSGREITTIEDEKYLIIDSVYYQGQEKQVLRGRSQILGTSLQPITRTVAPILSPNESINNNGVSDGNIVYYIRTSEYGSTVISETNSLDVSSRTLIQATYQQSGQNITKTLNGTFKYSLSSSSYIMVTFTPDEGQLTGVSLLSVSVQMYSANGLLSKALVIDNIYKLNDFSESYYDIVLIGEQTVLNFTNYFKYVTIAGSTSNYYIVIDYTTNTSTNQVILTRDNASKMFVITNDMTYVNVQARDNQDASTINRLKILYSDSLRFEVQNTIVQEDGQNLIDITWDTNLYSFVWNWTNGNIANDYEYYVQIQIDNTQTLSEMTLNNFYMPSQRGTITSFSIRARHVSQEQTGGTIRLYLFSQAIEYGVSGITFDIFSGGDGSMDNPYKISSAEDFYNISKRNTLDKQYYFILTTNITLDNDYLLNNGEHTMETFYGILDGNGYNITITADRLYEMEEYKDSITGIGTVTFSRYFSLFKEIASNAQIHNLVVDFIVNTTVLSGDNVLISPLALRNYGTLSNITINNINMTRLQGSGTVNNVFMGGIVSINLGDITNSVNNANLTYNMPQQLNINFGYGAIAVFNTSQGANSGYIANTFNNGNVTVNVRQRSINIYISGIVINNYSSLNMVGNNGDFTQTSTVSCAVYFTGIALYSEGASLNYNFNNGEFSTSSLASSNFAGIVYTLYGGSINYLADTQGYAIAKICQSSPIDNGVNYASANSGTVSTISTVELSQIKVGIGGGNYFVITLIDGKYLAYIE